MNKQQYIKENRNTNDIKILLRVLRYILETPEGNSILLHAELIMRKLHVKNIRAKKRLQSHTTSN